MSNKLKKLSDGSVWARWNERMTRVRHELHYVYSTRRKFNDVTSLFQNNEKLKSIGGEVYDWLFRMWARDIVIAIRRELDNNTNTVCGDVPFDVEIRRRLRCHYDSDGVADFDH